MIISAQKIRPYTTTCLSVCISDLLIHINALTLREKYCALRKKSDAFGINLYSLYILLLRVIKYVLRCAKNPTLTMCDINHLNYRLLSRIIVGYGAQKIRRSYSDKIFTNVSMNYISIKRFTVRKISGVLVGNSYLPYFLLFKVSNKPLRCAKNPTNISPLPNSQIICTLGCVETSLRCAEYMRF